MEAYDWRYCVERMRPRTRWRALYDELFAGLTSLEDGRSRDAPALVLLGRWSALIERYAGRCACLPHLTSHAYAT
jgi:hypothetical protein